MTAVESSLAPTDAIESALSIRDLRMSYIVRGTPREVLRGVTFDVQAGEAYGLVGESGCGKSTTAYAALRYLPSNGVITSGKEQNDLTSRIKRRARRSASNSDVSNKGKVSKRSSSASASLARLSCADSERPPVTVPTNAGR